MSHRRYEAVVFDMDGVLADSEPVYYAAMQEVLSPLGHRVTQRHQRNLMGHSIEDTWRYLAKEFDLQGSLDELVSAYDAELIRQLALVREPLPSVRELIGKLKQMGVPIAVASSSLPSWIEALLGGIGLQDAFDALVSGSMVTHPKPAPDIYLLAAERLGSSPERTIAIEDTPTGLASARGAGMYTVQVRAASTAFPPLPDADTVLNTLGDFDLSLLEHQPPHKPQATARSSDEPPLWPGGPE
jgi:HAD superfamily hydrolase (TIGR01509 family)